MAAHLQAELQFSRSTIPPRASRPTRCSVFLPGSIPMVTTAVLDLRGSMVLLLLDCPASMLRWQGGSTAGPSHSRTTVDVWCRAAVRGIADIKRVLTVPA